VAAHPAVRSFSWSAIRLAASLGAAAAVAAGCAPRRGDGARPDTLVFARGSDAQKLDPADVDDGDSVNVLAQVCEGLVRFRNGTLEIEPCLAEHYEVTPDGLAYVFRLRRGVRFHDGTPLDAAAAAWSFRRQMEAGHPGHVAGANFQYWSSLFQDVAEVRAIGAATLEFRLRQPNAPLLASLAICPAALISPAALEAHGEAFQRHPVGTGPYRFVRWTPNQAIVLEGNPDYWDAAAPPRFARLVFKVVPEGAVRLVELGAGRVHGSDGMQPAELERLARDRRFTVHRAPGLNLGYLVFNLARPRYAEAEVRLAFALAIDRARLARIALEGGGRAAGYPMPPGFLGYPKTADPVPHDPERARAILARRAAAFADPVRLQVMTAPRPFLPNPLEAASFVRAQLEAVGLRVEVVARDFKSHLDDLRNHDFDCAIVGWIGDNGDPDNFLAVLLAGWAAQDGTASNFAGYRNAEMDELLLAGRRAVDVSVRRGIYERALAVWRRDLPIVPLVHGDNIVVLRREAAGFAVQPTGDLRFGTVDWQAE
jgi:peptide/nickel transport system substrate-binding protein